jgi:hypothetical protein
MSPGAALLRSSYEAALFRPIHATQPLRRPRGVFEACSRRNVVPRDESSCLDSGAHLDVMACTLSSLLFKAYIQDHSPKTAENIVLYIILLLVQVELIGFALFCILHGQLEHRTTPPLPVKWDCQTRACLAGGFFCGSRLRHKFLISSQVSE